MKQFENGQKVLARLDDEGAFEEYDYIGTIPNFSLRPHAVRNDTFGLKAICDWNIKAAPVKKEGWVNLWRSGDGILRSTEYPYSTEEAAIAGARLSNDSFPPDYAGTARVTWEE